MSESRHTPGPWFAGGVRQKIEGQQALGIFRYDEANKRDVNIASVWYDPKDGAGTDDAALIAVAPRLYEFYRLTLEIEEAEREYYERSNTVQDRWETAGREEFSDLDSASHAIDEQRERLMSVRRSLRDWSDPIAKAEGQS